VQTKNAQTFESLLSVAALLPRADKELIRNYKLSRKQIYLIYLALHDDESKPKRLSDYARLLNISPSTLTRNIQKLEERKVLERVALNPGIGLKLLSRGQLYAIEIENYFDPLFELAASKLEELGLNIYSRV
jgi:DNA-binding MarR family transcriptional regulator